MMTDKEALIILDAVFYQGEYQIMDDPKFFEAICRAEGALKEVELFKTCNNGVSRKNCDTGYWILDGDGPSTHYICSNCKSTRYNDLATKYNYCPICGIKMIN